MIENKKSAGCRLLIGGLAGVGVLLLVGYIAGSFSLWGSPSFRELMLVDGAMVLRLGGSEGFAVAVQFTLFFLLGGAVGVSTLPFADGGRPLVLRSLAHFAVTAGLAALLAGLNFGADCIPACLILLAAVYGLIWLGRWVGWYAEAAAIRQRLGLSPGPSLFHWRETLPYLLLLAAVYLLPRPLLAPFDATDVPVLTGILLPWVLYPLAALVAGGNTGWRYGVCPLVPVTAFLTFLPNLLWTSPASDWTQGLVYAGLVLGANLAGAALRRGKSGNGKKRRKR